LTLADIPGIKARQNSGKTLYEPWPMGKPGAA